jgi:hypothetical protein
LPTVAAVTLNVARPSAPVVRDPDDGEVGPGPVTEKLTAALTTGWPSSVRLAVIAAGVLILVETGPVIPKCKPTNGRYWT